MKILIDKVVEDFGLLKLINDIGLNNKFKELTSLRNLEVEPTHGRDYPLGYLHVKLKLPFFGFINAVVCCIDDEGYPL